MSYPYEPVKGRYVAIDYCKKCGQAMVDLFTMSNLYNRQTWGEIDWQMVEKNNKGCWLWTSLCEQCHDLWEKVEKRKKKEKEKAESMRNCVVCGDPFFLYKWKEKTAIDYGEICYLTCSNNDCREEAKAVFNTGNGYGIKVNRMFWKTKNSIYDGRWITASIYYLQCKLLFTTREVYGRL